MQLLLTPGSAFQRANGNVPCRLHGPIALLYTIALLIHISQADQGRLRDWKLSPAITLIVIATSFTIALTLIITITDRSASILLILSVVTLVLILSLVSVRVLILATTALVLVVIVTCLPAAVPAIARCLVPIIAILASIS